MVVSIRGDVGAVGHLVELPFTQSLEARKPPLVYTAVAREDLYWRVVGISAAADVHAHVAEHPDLLACRACPELVTRTGARCDL